MPLCFIAAQQLPQYGLYMFEPYSFNPAYGGMNNSISVSADIRKQWSGLAGAPSSQYLTVHMPIYSLNSGVGLMLNNEELGANHQFQGQLSYNYVMSNLAAGLISIGASVGLINRNMDGSEIRTPGEIMKIAFSTMIHCFIPEQRTILAVHSGAGFFTVPVQ